MTLRRFCSSLDLFYRGRFIAHTDILFYGIKEERVVLKDEGNFAHEIGSCDLFNGDTAYLDVSILNIPKTRSKHCNGRLSSA